MIDQSTILMVVVVIAAIAAIVAIGIGHVDKNYIIAWWKSHNHKQ